MRSFLDSASIEHRGTSRELVVLLHSYLGSSERLCYVREIVATNKRDADIFTPSLPASTFSMASPLAIVNQLLKDIDALWEERQGWPDHQAYARITLVGHSLGALLARKIYVCACGQTNEVPFEDGIEVAERCVWADKVERIILLAGMNRGWSISSHMTIKNAIGWRLGSFVGELIWFVRRHRLLILAVRRGAPFITQLRLQWLAMQQHAAVHHLRTPLVIQLLGTVDDIVSPDDNIDLVTGANFIYRDVRWAGHGTIVDMTPTPEGQERAEAFLYALHTPVEVLSNDTVEPADFMPIPPDPHVTDVVFVIHGIRDLGFWTNKLARCIKKTMEQDSKRVVKTETSPYGYFAMLPFVLPSYRHAKMEWLMDQYTEDKALYPNAQFSFVGHSNGTYLLAHALETYPCCRFERVVFAGSVVHRRYNWAARGKQVQDVLNYVATGDWVVACFSKPFQTLHIEDLGSAGHDGFETLEASEPQQVRLQQVQYVPGAHSAALVEENWDAIANFIANGEVTLTPPAPFAKQQVPWVVWAGRLAPVIWLLLLAIAYTIGYGILSFVSPEWLKTALFIGYLWLLWKVLTNV